jgi:hypothetical protein
MNPRRAKIQRDSGPRTIGVDSPANAISRFDDKHIDARLTQRLCRGHAGYSRTDNDDRRGLLADSRRRPVGCRRPDTQDRSSRSRQEQSSAYRTLHRNFSWLRSAFKKRLFNGYVSFTRNRFYLFEI